ncbi:transcriptional regulator family: Fungal Specific TF [Penicillium longicatenatum]|uniref:transcriptional regulator family: Fungal Specific TF n=1 Tax=Penicillium longicatenatum TaxID=1561947 RepID=UPI0025484BA7|nr:transcriptional regulator family: Fungal Specific TF [Penicillium longicatenatum]KAJ5649622.1 transcriptional regulator family: Fungal Specific TF [Penicillium longicatenatum]
MRADVTSTTSGSDLGNDQTCLPTTECRERDSVNPISKSPTYSTVVGQRISSVLLQAHVEIFLEHLYPIMPVFDADAVMVDCANPEILPPRRYAFLAAMCAATHLQLKLDLPHGATHGEISPSGRSLIDQAIQALRDFDPVDEPHIDSLLTFFFLFSAYGNLDQHDHAWHYLSQSISFAFLLKLHQEQTYLPLDAEVAELKRRIYWLLFITERAYALQRSMPIVLRACIQKPSVFASKSPAIAYGFVNLISVFEKLPLIFFDWDASAAESLIFSDTANSVYHCMAISTPLLAEYNETQRVDLVVTQQWLQARLWKVYTKQDSSKCNQGTVIPVELLVNAGKSVMALMSTVSQKSADAHGIGIEQKLYDIGEAISLLAYALLPRTNDSAGELFTCTQGLLCGILHRLSSIRGSQSYLFDPLLQKSHEILGLDSLPASLAFQTQLIPDIPTEDGLEAADSGDYDSLLL